jgi:hypothetical protein
MGGGDAAGATRQRSSWAAVVHRRRLRDGCAARIRPARRQPHGQRFRHLRRDQLRGVRGRHGRERDHARGDVPGASTRRSLPIENASLRTLLRPNYRGFAGASPAPAARRGHGPPSGGQHRGDFDGRRRHGPRRGPADRRLPQPRHRAVRPQRALRSGPHQRLSRPRSELRIVATDLDTCERIVFGEGDGTTSRSRAPSPPPGPADRLRAIRATRQAADRRRDHLTTNVDVRGRGRAPSSSWWSTRLSPT